MSTLAGMNSEVDEEGVAGGSALGIPGSFHPVFVSRGISKIYV